MKINRRRLWGVVFKSWGFTILALLLTFIWVCILSAIGVTRIGPRVFIFTVSILTFIMVMVFIFSEMIINFVFSARPVDPENPKEAAFQRLLTELCTSKGMWFHPRARVMHRLDVANAMAYGMGFPFFRAIGVTPKLLELLDEDQLRAVIAHELAHIRCYDVGLLTMMGILTSIPERIGRILTDGTTVLGKSYPAFIIGYFFILFGKYVLGVLRFALQQEREFAADALAASYVGEITSLISALRTLSLNRQDQGELFMEGNHRHPIERLMVSHPGLDERIASLESITKEA